MSPEFPPRSNAAAGRHVLLGANDYEAALLGGGTRESGVRKRWHGGADQILMLDG